MVDRDDVPDGSRRKGKVMDRDGRRQTVDAWDSGILEFGWPERNGCNSAASRVILVVFGLARLPS